MSFSLNHKNDSMTIKKTKLLFLINNLRSGGAERVLVNLINNLDQSTFECTLFTLSNTGVNKEFLQPHIKYHYLFKKEIKGINYLRFLPKILLEKIFYKEKYDIIIPYLHGVLTSIVSKSKPQNSKTIAWLHADMSKSLFMKKLIKSNSIHKTFHNYDAIVGVSRIVTESFITATSIKHNVYTIYNTFDHNDIRVKGSAPLPKRYQYKNIFRVVSVGTLGAVKGYERLIKVCHLLKISDVNFELFIVGDGEDKTKLQNLINEYNLEKTVFLTGFQKNPYNFIKNADLYVCSSYSEGYSSVVVESIILETPILTTECAGMDEILGENNQYGMIIKNNDHALFNGLKNIIQNKNIYDNLKSKAIKRSSFFTSNKSINNTEDFLNKILEK